MAAFVFAETQDQEAAEQYFARYGYVSQVIYFNQSNQFYYIDLK